MHASTDTRLQTYTHHTANERTYQSLRDDRLGTPLLTLLRNLSHGKNSKKGQEAGLQ
jgi:hypothetical protein